eukprot:6187613-Pleurochrysis_carterae.AAC.7
MRVEQRIETGISVFALIVDLVSVGRVDSVDQSKVHASRATHRARHATSGRTCPCMVSDCAMRAAVRQAWQREHGRVVPLSGQQWSRCVRATAEVYSESERNRPGSYEFSKPGLGRYSSAGGEELGGVVDAGRAQRSKCRVRGRRTGLSGHWMQDWGNARFARAGEA